MFAEREGINDCAKVYLVSTVSRKRIYLTVDFTIVHELLRWSRGSVLAFGIQVRGLKPGRNLRIFQGEKILSTPSFGREVKPFAPCRIFAA